MKKSKNNTEITLKKACTLTKKVTEMYDNNVYCIDIIQQNLAIIGLLKSVNLQLLENHLNCCFKDAINNKNEEIINQMLQEIMLVVKTAQNK